MIRRGRREREARKRHRRRIICTGHTDAHGASEWVTLKLGHKKFAAYARTGLTPKVLSRALHRQVVESESRQCTPSTRAPIVGGPPVRSNKQPDPPPRP